ncbi:MAG: hypothetical protein U0800_18175 [Isosphaeraceae bacterium]
MSQLIRQAMSGDVLARNVRVVARLAHELVREARLTQAVDAARVDELVSRIDRLRGEARGTRQAEIRGWLVGLADRLHEIREPSGERTFACR